MKQYVILIGSIEQIKSTITNTNEEGLINSVDFNLAGEKSSRLIKDAEDVRDRLVGAKINELLSKTYEGDSNYSCKVVTARDEEEDEEEINDVYIDTYYEDKIINRTIYKIRAIQVPPQTEWEAWEYLIDVILKENGYYEALNEWMADRGLDAADIKRSLFKKPDDMSIYCFLGILENALDVQEEARESENVLDLIYYIKEHGLWEE